MQDKLGKTLEILFEPKINSLKIKEITLGCYKTQTGPASWTVVVELA
jgi:hypothetical protein